MFCWLNRPTLRKSAAFTLKFAILLQFHGDRKLKLQPFKLTKVRKSGNQFNLVQHQVAF